MDKLGLHIVEGFSGPLCKSDGTPPRLVKLVDASVGYVRQVRAQVGPRCVIIIRWFEPEQPLVDPTARARQWFERRRAEMLLMREAAGPNIAFEAYNEIPDHQAAAYCQFEVERLALMHAAGLHAVVGNFSVGTPDLPTWAAYRPMLDEMQDGDLLGLHEYWSDSADLSNMWHVGRWRLLPQLDGIPIVVTECGRDVVEGRGKAGWRRTCNADEFLADLRQYNDILMQQDRILGATVFGGGKIYSPWQPFEVNDLWPRVIAEYNPHRYADQQPAPQPQPVVGFPVIDKVCMAIKNTDKRWYEASSRYGRYDGHPERAEDWNLESGGNTDLGEPLVAPFNGLVVNAANYGGGWGKIVSIVGVTKAGVLVTWQGRHLHTMTVKAGQVVKMGDPIGSIGNADGRYAGAHLHEQIIMGEMPGPTEDWRNTRYNYVRPSEWYISMGVNRAMVDRLRKWDGR